MENNNTASGALIVTGSAIGALLGGVPGAIGGAIVGSIIQEIIKCPKCSNNMNWNLELKKYVCNVCGYGK